MASTVPFDLAAVEQALSYSVWDEMGKAAEAFNEDNACAVYRDILDRSMAQVDILQRFQQLIGLATAGNMAAQKGRIQSDIKNYLLPVIPDVCEKGLGAPL